ncbi:FecR family protein [Desertivirga brevis]|uniref:FecR family protein n=1 Tax=Desertivirga brevis TaxID=2810310 RepID=UPI001A97A3B7|nr:FecR domain-containing protein [Pedobacter sp. SYSU D00873]
MNIQKEEFMLILEKYRTGKASREEEDFLLAYYKLFDLEEDLLERLSNEEKQRLKNTIRAKIKAAMSSEETPRIRRLPAYLKQMAAAAAVIILCLSSYFIYQSKFEISKSSEAQSVKIVPGGNRAVLTLADGSTILLEDEKDGELAQRGGISIRKTGEGQVVFDASRNTAQGGNAPAGLNTISTPRGGHYRLTLPDGSKVWLNAASSIRFPTMFSATERKVLVEGEAYFEIEKLSLPGGKGRVPFLVVSGAQTVEVLGTKFNLNSYADENAIVTTLIEGAVKVRSAKAPAAATVLRPGQQSVLPQGSHVIAVSDADTEIAVAWKEGYFRFDKKDLRAIMRQLSRWYDVEVEYAAPVTNEQYVGKIKRSEEVSGVLRVLELGDVRFTINGRKIKVENN